MTFLYKNLYRGLRVIICSFSAMLTFSPHADDAKLPEYETCQTIAYISQYWNIIDKNYIKNNTMALKKVICQSGKEAYLLVELNKNQYQYTLSNHLKEILTKSNLNMCKMVNLYCEN